MRQLELLQADLVPSLCISAKASDWLKGTILASYWLMLRSTAPRTSGIADNIYDQAPHNEDLSDIRVFTNCFFLCGGGQNRSRQR